MKFFELFEKMAANEAMQPLKPSGSIRPEKGLHTEMTERFKPTMDSSKLPGSASRDMAQNIGQKQPDPGDNIRRQGQERDKANKKVYKPQPKKEEPKKNVFRKEEYNTGGSANQDNWGSKKTDTVALKTFGKFNTTVSKSETKNSDWHKSGPDKMRQNRGDGTVRTITDRTGDKGWVEDKNNPNSKSRTVRGVKQTITDNTGNKPYVNVNRDSAANWSK